MVTTTQDETPVRAEDRIIAARGTTLRCKGWRQEALLRMLENTLENAERPKELVVYAGFAKAARDWRSYHAIVAALRDLEVDQTLVIQSGKPIGVFKTHGRAPLVLMATGNLVGRWATPEDFYELSDRGLTIWGGLTAADWQYIGSQGVIQGTYEIFAAVAREHFGGSLKGRFILTAGMGGMGGAQPLAGTLAGAVILAVEVEPARIERRVTAGFCQHMAHDLDRGTGSLPICPGAGDTALGRPRRERCRGVSRVGAARHHARTSSPTKPQRTIPSTVMSQPDCPSPRRRRCAGMTTMACAAAPQRRLRRRYAPCSPSRSAERSCLTTATTSVPRHTTRG